MSNVKDVKAGPGEALILWRRRKGFTQAQAAINLDVSYDWYRDWEAGARANGPVMSLGELKPWEKCYLLRRRRGLTQKEVADKIGLTRLWVHKMEAGHAPIGRLRDHWGI